MNQYKCTAIAVNSVHKVVREWAKLCGDWIQSNRKGGSSRLAHNNSNKSSLFHSVLISST